MTTLILAAAVLVLILACWVVVLLWRLRHAHARGAVQMAQIRQYRRQYRHATTQAVQWQYLYQHVMRARSAAYPGDARAQADALLADALPAIGYALLDQIGEDDHHA